MPIIEVPGQGKIRFPDGMSDQEISQAIQHNFPDLSSNAGEASAPPQEQSGGFMNLMKDTTKALVGAFPLDTAKKIGETGVAGVAGAAQGTIGLSEQIFRTPSTAARFINTVTNGIWQGATKAQAAMHDVLVPWDKKRGDLPVPPNPMRIDPQNDLLLKPFNQTADEISRAQQILASDTLKDTPIGKPFYDLAQSNQRAEEAFTKAIENKDIAELIPILSDTKAWAGFIGNAAPSLAAAYTSGGSMGFISWMEGMQQATDAADFERRTGQHVSDEEFTQGVLQAASINAILEKLGLDKVVQSGQMPGVLRKILAGMVEGGTEAGQQLNTNLAGLLSYSPDPEVDKTIKEALKNKDYAKLGELLQNPQVRQGVLQSFMGGFGSGTAAAHGLQKANQAMMNEQTNLPGGTPPETPGAPLGAPPAPEQQVKAPEAKTTPFEGLSKETVDQISEPVHVPRGTDSVHLQHGGGTIAVVQPSFSTKDFQIHPDAQNFGLEKFARTVPDGDALLQPTDQINTPERLQRRQAIVDEHLAGKTAPTDRAPLAMIMGGGGASGKSTVLEALQDEGIVPTENLVNINPDDIKENLPEFKSLQDRGDFRAAGVVHEESSMLKNQILDAATSRGLDVSLDVVLGNPDKARAQLQGLKDKGYNVVLVGVTANADEAIRRAVARGRKTGRYVLPSSLLKAHKGFSQGWESYQNLVDESMLYDTNNAATLIAQKSQGNAMEIHDQAAYNRFLSKGVINDQATTLRELRASQGTAQSAEANKPVGNQPSQSQPGQKAAAAQKPSGVRAERVNAPASEQRAAKIAQTLTKQEILTEIDALSKKAAARMEELRKGSRASYAAESAIDFMSPADKERFNDLKLALPSQAEEAIQARARIQERLKARKSETFDAKAKELDTAPIQAKEVTALDNMPLEGAGTLHANPLNVIYKTWQHTAGQVLNQAHDLFGWRMTALGKLPAQDVYLARRYRTLGRIAKTDEVARRIYDTFAAASKADSAKVYEFLTQRDAEPGIIADPAVRRSAIATKRLINRIGQALVQRGLLSQETYNAHKGSYLPRIYLKHLLDEKTWKALGSGKKVSDLGYLKKRQDIPEEVRKVILGEITDPAYLASKGAGRALRDIAILDFLTDIAKTEKWVYQDSLVKWGKRDVSATWLAEEANRLEQQAAYYNEDLRNRALEVVKRMRSLAQPAIEATGKVPSDFRQVPDTARYGQLRGMWIRKEIYNDLIGSAQAIPSDSSPAEWLLGYGGFGTKVTQLWKMSKVALNPPTQIRNFISNGIMLHWSGVPFHMVPIRVTQALSEMAHNGKHWRIAKKWGVTASTFSANELFRIEREILDLESRTASEGGNKFTMARIRNLAGIIGNTAGDIYQLSEGVFKTAKIIDEMTRNGKSESEAITEAQKWLYDYSLIPPSVRYLRNAPVGVPFMTFYYKTAPRFAEVMLKHPHRLLPYYMILGALAAYIADDYDVDKKDLDAFKKALPQWLQDRGNAFFLPYKDAYGRWQALDIGYFLPWAVFNEAAKEAYNGDVGGVVSTLGLLGGPIPDLITAVKTGIDPFTKREIFDSNDPPSRQMADISNYLWRMSMPTFTTDLGFAGHMYKAVKGSVDKYGDPKDTVAQAALRLFGVNVYPVEPLKSRRENLRRMAFEMQEIRKRMKYRMRDKNLSASEKENIRKEYVKLIEAQRERIAKYREESQINPKLLGEGGKFSKTMERRLRGDQGT